MRDAPMPVRDAGGNGSQCRSRSAAQPSAPLATGSPRAVASQGCRLRLSSMGPPGAGFRRVFHLTCLPRTLCNLNVCVCVCVFTCTRVHTFFSLISSFSLGTSFSSLSSQRQERGKANREKVYSVIHICPISAILALL